jgi:hypothetical protein
MVVSSPATPPPLDLDQVASMLASLRPGWTGQGLTAGPLAWRDARASWPQPMLTDRSLVAEPESVGLTLTTADGRAGRLVIWRGGWADIDLLDGETVTSRNPALHDLADCIAEARSLASQLTAAPPPLTQHPPDLGPVPPTIIATTAAIGAVSGHLWCGMSRSDCKELGELIDDGQAALVIVGRARSSRRGARPR